MALMIHILADNSKFLLNRMHELEEEVEANRRRIYDVETQMFIIKAKQKP